MSFARDNKDNFTLFLSLGGAFAGIVVGFIDFLKEDTLKDYLYYATLVVIILLTFLAIMSILFGYSRRRDHILICMKEYKECKQSMYESICGNGTGKGCLGFLPDYYLAFFIFFYSMEIITFIVMLLVLDYEAVCYFPIAIIGFIGGFTLLAPVCVLFAKFKKYKSICSKRLDYLGLSDNQ